MMRDKRWCRKLEGRRAGATARSMPRRTCIPLLGLADEVIE
jgi:hypothetical protein